MLEIKLKPDTNACYVRDNIGAIAIRTKFGWYTWKKGEGWVLFPQGNDISNGKSAGDWGYITEEQALARIEEIEKVGYDVKSKVVDYVFP